MTDHPANSPPKKGVSSTRQIYTRPTLHNTPKFMTRGDGWSTAPEVCNQRFGAACQVIGRPAILAYPRSHSLGLGSLAFKIHSTPDITQPDCAKYKVLRAVLCAQVSEGPWCIISFYAFSTVRLLYQMSTDIEVVAATHLLEKIFICFLAATHEVKLLVVAVCMTVLAGCE